MITKIEVENYRCFPRLSVDCGPYQVLAGANGAGKSTLLDIVPLIGDLLDAHRVTEAFLQRVGSRQTPRATTLAELPYRGTGDTIAFAIEAELPDTVAKSIAEASLSRPLPTHLRYELLLEVNPYELSVAEEYLFLFPGPGGSRTDNAITLAAGEPSDNAANRELIPLGRPVDIDRVLQSPDWQSVISRQGRGPTRFTVEATASGTELPPLAVPTSRLALGSVPLDPTLFPAALWFAELLRSETVFYDPTWADLRRPAPPGDPARLLASGRNTPWLALRLQQTDRDRFDSWVDHVRTALPQVTHIEPRERADDRYAYLAVEYSSGYQVTSSGLSDGTLRILALTLLPYLPQGAAPSLLVTEEPENGIHPRAIETVTQSLSSIYESQVWVSTHSPMVLAQTELQHMLATRLEADGSASVVPGPQHPKLRDWQGSLDLGTLFAAGVLN